eukprot:UN0093
MEATSVTWDTAHEDLEVRGARIPCLLRISLERCSGGKLDWALELHVCLSASDLPVYSQGVHKAVVVHLFTSSPHWHARAPRCVSFTGCDGQVPVLPDGNALCSEQPHHWLHHLLVRGEIYAIAVVDCVEYMM